MRGPGVCGLTELSSSARFGEDAEEPFQPARGCHEDQPASLRHNSAMGMRHAARQKGQATWPNLELLVATLASLIDKNSAESAMLQCHGPHHGNAEQHVTDYEQDRRQSIDDHHAEDDLVTSTLLPAARTAASVMGEPPIGRNVVFCGINIFRLAHGKIVQRRRPERSPRSRARSQTCGSRTRWR
jgi:predicted ester cyclase